MQKDNSAWPPTYSIRISKKAKRMILSISKLKTLEVILPYHYRHLASAKIIDFLNEKRHWIEKHTQPLSHVQFFEPIIPEKIDLLSINESWKIMTRQSTKDKIQPDPKEQKLVLFYQPKDNLILGKIELIKQWLRTKAKHHLIPWLENLSRNHQLVFNRVSIRNQKTLWGSCNRNKNISLNFKLLFLPKTLVEYVLLHELSHTKHLNHSKSFWDLLSRLDPYYKKNDYLLKHTDQYLPSWIDYSK